MRVYVVTETTVNGETSDEYTSVARVFSTEEKAKAYVDSFGKVVITMPNMIGLKQNKSST